MEAWRVQVVLSIGVHACAAACFLGFNTIKSVTPLLSGEQLPGSFFFGPAHGVSSLQSGLWSVAHG
jgi:hypothetical protein